MPDPRGGMTDEEIMIRILVATQEAVKNLEQLNSHFDRFNASASKAKTGASQFGEAANKATSDTVSGAKAAGAGMDDLSKKIKNGTASMKEYSQAVRAGLVIPPATIKSLESISAMGSKSQWIPNVGAVRTAMEQIMQSVNVNSTKAGQILRNTFHNIPVQAIQTAERQINQSMMGIRGIVHNIFSDLKAAVQTFFGVTMAMTVFNAAKLVSDFFKSSIQEARDFERETRELNLAEAILSKAGVDIVKKELDDLVNKLYNTYDRMLSKVEFQSITSEVSIMARDFGLAKDEIFKLIEVIAYLQVQNRLAGKEDIRASQLVDAIFDRRTRALSTYGIDVSEKALERVALQNGIIKEGEALDENTKRLAAIQSAYDATVGYQDEFMSSIEGTREQLVLQNQEMLKLIRIDVGNWFLDVEFSALQMLNTVKELIVVLDHLSDSTGKTQKFSNFLLGIWDFITAGLRLVVAGAIAVGTIIAAGIGAWMVFIHSLQSGTTLVDALKQAQTVAIQALGRGFLWFFDWIIGQADNKFNRWLKERAKILGLDIDLHREQKSAPPPDPPDTPTGERWESDELDEEAKKLEDALKKMNDAILEAQLKLEQDMEEASIKLGRKMVDIDREYLKKREEAYLDFTKKIRDINASFDEKIRDIRQSSNESAQKFRNDELKREEDFQNKMKELKEKFLMDMDEALHARDARQILRLIKQYNLDKTQLERRHELDKTQARREEEERQIKFKQEIADAERQRQLKLRQAEIEYRDKLEKLKREEEAEREAAKIAYQREIDDLHRKMHDRLELIAAGLVNEFNLTKDGLDAITKLYMRYYENVRQIYEAMNHMLSGRQNLTAPSAPPRGSSGGGGGMRMAKGGALLANRPTNVVFGEAGAELATFIPLSKMGSGLSSMFGGLGGGDGGSNGGLQIDVTLSPDLEARIVNNTLNKASNIIAKVQREKRQ